MLRTSLLRSTSTPLFRSLPAHIDRSRFFASSQLAMSALKAGDKFPEGVKFSYVPYEPSKAGLNQTCGMPQEYDASKEFANKKVVLFAVPGAFTPTCAEQHLPTYLNNLEKFKEKGYDTIIALAYNDAWVMSAWGKAYGIKNNEILFMNDPETAFSKKIGWTAGERTGRYAIAIDKGTVTYAEKEPARGVTVSGAEEVLAKL